MSGAGTPPAAPTGAAPGPGQAADTIAVGFATSDGLGIEVAIPAGMTLLQGAKAAGFTLPSLCEKGSAASAGRP